MSSLVSCLLTLRLHLNNCDFDSCPLFLVSLFSLSIHTHKHIHIVTIIVYYISWYWQNQQRPEFWLKRLLVPVTRSWHFIDTGPRTSLYHYFLNISYVFHTWSLSALIQIHSLSTKCPPGRSALDVCGTAKIFILEHNICMKSTCMMLNPGRSATYSQHLAPSAIALLHRKWSKRSHEVLTSEIPEIWNPGHIYSNSCILLNFHTNMSFTIQELPGSNWVRVRDSDQKITLSSQNVTFQVRCDAARFRNFSLVPKMLSLNLVQMWRFRRHFSVFGL